MKRTAILAVLCFATLHLANGPALAQNAGRPLGGPYASSPVSPYLNLNRFGTPAALNYYNLVRPEFAMQNAINGLQQNQFALGRQNNAIEGDIADLTTSGHRFGYFTHTRYFLNNRTGGGQGLGTGNRAGRQGAGGAQGAGGQMGGSGRGVPTR